MNHQSLLKDYPLYEKDLKSYYKKPQPQIIDIKINVDLFPEKRTYRSYGSLKLRNETSGDISELFIQVPNQIITNKLQAEIPFHVKDTFSDFGVSIVELDEPML